ncbi:MAG: DegV family protein [bacterium]|nr:DegV family protein [bacterium]
MKIAVSAESTVDLTKELAEKFDISIIPYPVIMGDKEYLDGEITSKDIFDFVAKTNILPKTSAINEETYEDYFKGLLKNYDAVIHVCLSSKISSSIKNATNAAKKLKNVYIVDSESLSTGIALLCIKAREMAEKNIEPQIIATTLSELSNKVQASFVLEKLKYLAKGGRCSSILAFGANLLSIRPQIVLNDGKMGVGKKYLGKFDKCVCKYIDDTLAQNTNPDLDHAFITYTTSNDIQVNYAKEALKKAGFVNIYETEAHATITSHCGPNTIGILFINK